jgi:hypothetical protein
MAKFLDNNGVLYLLSKLLFLFVRQEAGKGLSQNDLTDALKQMILDQFDGTWASLTGKPTNVSAWTNDAGYQTGTEVAGAIASALSLSGFQTAAEVETAIETALSLLDTDVFVVEEELPDPGEALPNKIYLVPVSDGHGGSIMEQWILVEGAWEKVGTVEVSLEGYYNEDNLVPITNSEIDGMIASLS